jgi:hypothetical protein
LIGFYKERFLTYLLGFVFSLANASAEPEFVSLLRSQGIDSQPGGPALQPYSTYRPVRLHRLTESMPWNRLLGFLNIYKFGLWTIPTKTENFNLVNIFEL